MSNYNKSMEQKNMIALMSRITELTNRMFIDELKAHDIQGIVPSHGGIMMRLFSGKQYTMQEMAAAIHRTKPTLTVLSASWRSRAMCVGKRARRIPG